MRGGYIIGPSLPCPEQPWGYTWESDPRIDDGHRHEWENVMLAPGPCRHHFEEVIRCIACHAPRCGESRDEDPCMLRRHHTVPHEMLSGHTRVVGA